MKDIRRYRNYLTDVKINVSDLEISGFYFSKSIDIQVKL